MQKILLKGFDVLKHIIFFIFVFIITARFIAVHGELDFDNLWHLKMGEDIVKNGVIDFNNYYSWIEGTQWNQQEWLFDVLLYLSLSVFGIVGYYLFYTISQIILYFSGYLLNRKILHYPIVYFIFLIVFLYNTPIVLMNRPAGLSTLFVILFMLLFKQPSWKTAIVYFISGVIIGNLHCGTIIPLLVLFLLQFALNIISDIFICDTKEKKTIDFYIYNFISLGLFIIGACINPRGVIQLFDMFIAIRLDTVQYITEWCSYPMENYMLAFMPLFIVLSFGYSLCKKRWSRDMIVEIGTITAFLLASFVSVKSINTYQYLFIVFGYKYVDELLHSFIQRVYIMKPKITSIGNRIIQISKIKITRWTILIPIICGLSLVSVLYPYGVVKSFDSLLSEKQSRYVNDDILEYLKEHPNEHLLHGYITGNILMYNNIKVFVDTRQHPYVKEFGFSETMDNLMDIRCSDSKSELDMFFDYYDFTEVLINKDLSLQVYLAQRDDFEIKIKDEEAGLYLWVRTSKSDN